MPSGPSAIQKCDMPKKNTKPQIFVVVVNGGQSSWLMGIPDFLPRVLSSAGRQVDLTRYTQVEYPENDNNDTNDVNPSTSLPSTSTPRNQAPKRPRPWDGVKTMQESDDPVTQQRKCKRIKRRPLRIGVDVSVWISKAAHGFGDMLLDERHLSNFGRASLLQQQEEKEKVQLELEQAQAQQDQEKAQHDQEKAVSQTDESLLNDHSEDSDGENDGLDPEWKIKGTARPRRPVNASHVTTRSKTAKRNSDPAKATNRRSGAIAPNPQMIQNFVMTCAQYVMKRLDTLRELTKADVLVVLDGKTPPVKAKEVKRRSERRSDAEQVREDGPTIDLDEVDAAAVPRMKASRTAGAGRYYGEVVSELLKAMRSNQIPFLVAPFEADSQLAYLSNQGYIDLIITEDSDLLAHGPRSVLFKAIDPIGQQRATGILVHSRDLGAGHGNLCLSDFSTVMLAIMFVAAGCDYCEKLKGIGIVGACNAVRGVFFSSAGKHQPPRLETFFQRLYQSCYHKHLSVEAKGLFEANFLAALAMYRHPIVYDPIQRKCVIVNDPFNGGLDEELVDYSPYAALCTNRERLHQVVGVPLDSRIATHIAEGWINPKTSQPYSGIDLPTYVKYDLEQVVGKCDPGGGGEDDQEDEAATQDVTQDLLRPPNPSDKDEAARKADVEEEKKDAHDANSLHVPASDRMQVGASQEEAIEDRDGSYGFVQKKVGCADDKARNENCETPEIEQNVDLGTELNPVIASRRNRRKKVSQRPPDPVEIVEILSSDDEGPGWQTQRTYGGVHPDAVSSLHTW